MRTTITIIISICVALTAGAKLFAEVINVPDDFETIQEGIDAAEGGDTVLVQPGTYVGNIDFDRKAIVLSSLYLTTEDTAYVDSTIIEGEEEGNGVVSIQDIEDLGASLIGLTIRNGNNYGIYCTISRSVIRNCIVEENRRSGIISSSAWTEVIDCKIINNGDSGIRASERLTIRSCFLNGNIADDDEGGGISFRGDGIFQAFDCTIVDNSSDAGGGISIEDEPDVTIENCVVTGNNSSFGGGIGIYGEPNVTIENCIISENNAEVNGGGIGCEGNANILVVDCEITLNTATGSGGGILCNSNLRLENCDISGNTAREGYGGGVKCASSNPVITNCIIANNNCYYGGAGLIFTHSNPVLTDCQIYNNSSETDAGGIDCSNSSPIIQMSIISGNSSVDYGGGIYCRENSEPLILNSTIFGNSSEYGGGIYTNIGSNLTIINTILRNDSPEELYFAWREDPCSLLIAYSDIENGIEGIIDNENVEITWEEGNIDEDPLFVDPDNGDFHLTENSPCIDAGDPDSPRDPDSTRADMGAYYYHQEVSVLPDFILHPSSFILYSAYPNPFNSTTTITYGLGKPAPTRLALYDLLGQRITTLFEGYKQSGVHTATLTADDHLSSGLYFVRLETSGKILSRKVLLMK